MAPRDPQRWALFVGHRVACHWAEAIDRGEITPHEVTPVLVAPDDDGLAGDPFMGPASVTEVL